MAVTQLVYGREVRPPRSLHLADMRLVGFAELLVGSSMAKFSIPLQPVDYPILVLRISERPNSGSVLEGHHSHD